MPITFSQLISGQYHTQRRNAVLTFDDGLIDNYDKAFPILKEFGFRATFFIIARFDKVTRWVNPKTSNWSDYSLSKYAASPSRGAHKVRYGNRLPQPVSPETQ